MCRENIRTFLLLFLSRVRPYPHTRTQCFKNRISRPINGVVWNCMKKKPNRQPYRSSKMEHFQPRICFIFMTISRCRCRCCRRRMHSGWLRFRLFTVHLLAQSGIHRCRSPFLLHCRWSDCWCWCRYCWLSCTHSFSLYLYLFQFTAPTPNQRSLLYPSYSLPVYYQNAMFFYKPESYCNYFIIFMHIRQFQPFPNQ